MTAVSDVVDDLFFLLISNPETGFPFRVEVWRVGYFMIFHVDFGLSPKPVAVSNEGFFFGILTKNIVIMVVTVYWEEGLSPTFIAILPKNSRISGEFASLQRPFREPFLFHYKP